MDRKTFSFIGMGNMGYAMLKGALSIYDSKDIAFTCLTQAKKDKIYEETKVSALPIEECAKAKYVILAVKPQVYDTVIAEFKDSLSEDSIVISLAPGLSIETVAAKFGKKVRIVRAMPNTPALVLEGMTGISYNDGEFSDEEIERITEFFNSFGKSVRVPEKLMSAVVCASGSSPAYVYMFIEALADSVVKYGIPRKDAYELVAQTVLGAAKMVLETGEHPGKLKDNVCSPGGTTIRAVGALEEYGLRNALFKASDECYKACTGK